MHISQGAQTGDSMAVVMVSINNILFIFFIKKI